MNEEIARKVVLMRSIETADALQAATNLYIAAQGKGDTSGMPLAQGLAYIENLQVVSGHPMLTQSALEAVRQWKYRPYLLNGEPVEVETTIQVNFNLGG